MHAYVGSNVALGGLYSQRPVLFRSSCCKRRLLATPAAGLRVHAAAAVALPADPATCKPWWSKALDWWDVGQAESEKSQKPQKISATLNMAASLISGERSLIAAAAFLMVSCEQHIYIACPVTACNRCTALSYMRKLPAAAPHT